MVYANKENLQLTPYGFGHTITYIFDGQVKTKYITEEMYRAGEPLETLGWMQVLTILSVW